MIVNRLTKSTRFLPVESTYKTFQYAEPLFQKLLNCMVYQLVLYQTKIPFSHHIFGKPFREP